ncbi:GntR family transcriptional regulator [Oceanomicrobium pacificus]|uniref:UTRA domain-containing protein n=1 Tax=Oceanomicrobium pacificus TaxID=2692916 RepID=A0A6B0TQ22_9RHOB|nr:GntR family transcriptional regulator [Oceanomicrobium pacificus]MXU66036.1 UTRA domain-containing protein [Oceanomicrobium pacificus]
MESVPIYQAIQDHFLSQISSGALPPGTKLPTEKEIARQFGTSRATVQNAMSKLVYAGQIEKRVGSGTFVAETARSATMEVVGVKSFEEDASTRGQQVDYRLITLARDPADAALADALDIEEGETVLRFERLRLVGGTVIGLERRTFTHGLLTDISLDALDRSSTHELVEQYVPDPVGRMEASIRAVVAGDDMAAKLGVAPGAPLLRRSHRMFSRAGRPILLGEAFYCEPFAFRYIAHSPSEL